MKPQPTKKLLRCAIYTRKSTEHNLDLEFNSLDAQREACEAYIKSQAHEGWRLVRARYDDGGLSGASLDRPAVQALLGDVRGGKVDVIVVYKVDRLTRSLADFAKLVELFDQHSVSFVSITQSFNTTSSMGRLTLNVLLSFAQFEREVIGERVRDKIAASKRRGLWVGGPIPLGYATVNIKLVVVPEEAEIVRAIFRHYLQCGSVGALAEELTRRRIVSKVRTIANGRTQGGGPYSVGALAHFLKNRFYVGEVVYRGEVYAGEHEPIIDRSSFDAVQAKLAENLRTRRVRVSNSPAILMGRIFDDRGNRMTPSHSNKDGVRYRYYVSHAVLQRRKQDAGRVARVPAIELEKPVRLVAMDFFPIPFLTSNVVSGVLKSAFRKFDISDDDLILIDTALDDSVDGRDFHHFQAEIAELVRSNKCSVRPAERHPRDTRLRLQLRQKNELSFVRFTRLEDVLKK